MTIQLIPAEEQDRTFFRKAHHIAYRPVIESMFGWDEKAQDNYADKDFDERSPHIILFENQKAGVIGWQDKPDYIWFGPIFILPEYQGNGIGSILVKQFMDRANTENISLKLQTLKMNLGAKKLYEKLGFKVILESDIYWQMEYSVSK